MKRIIFIVLALLVLGGGTYFIFNNDWQNELFQSRESTIQQGVQSPPPADQNNRPNIEVIAEDLDIPWEVVFLPDGSVLVTERPGALVKVSPDKQVITEIEGVRHVGEGGLLGMVLHPDFINNRYIYLYLTTQTNGGLTNRVERYQYENDTLSDRLVIMEGIPGANYHDGGRMAFGPDGKLYVTTGDAGQESLAQDTGSLAGKILRLNEDGSIPEDNPFGNAVYSHGHRNPQGLAWDDQGRLWATEHGPSGINSGFDEINRIEAGGNYGWPEQVGERNTEGFTAPVIQSGADDTWAPAGAAFFDGSIFFAGLRGSALYEAKIQSGENLELVQHFKNEYGRLRAVVMGPDGHLYVTTSNTDGRGDPRPGDDKLIRINPEIFR